MITDLNPIVLEVLEGIFSGKLAHSQIAYHCGTSHCVAGWIEVEFLQRELGIKFDQDLYDSNEGYEVYQSYFTKAGILDYSTWDRAERIGNLTPTEATLLFACSSTLDFQKQIYEYLKQGNRITNDPMAETPYVVDGLEYAIKDQKFIDFLKQNKYPTLRPYEAEIHRDKVSLDEDIF